MGEKEYIVGIDIGGTNVRIGFVDNKYNLSHFEIFSINKMTSDGDVIDNLIIFIKKYLSKYSDDKKILGLSAGFPSTIDKSRKILLSTPNINGLNNINVADRLEDAINLPVCIDRDVNMILLHDMFQKNIPQRGICCGFYVGTGLGNAISINGELLIGKNGSAAELGHIPSRDLKGNCGCGNTSCVELFASGKYLSSLFEENYNDCLIREVFTYHREDPIIKKYVHDLAIPIATEINILDPDYTILGGGVIQMRDFPKEYLEASIREFARKPYPEKELDFKYSEPGQEIGVIGAGISGFKKLNKED